jgi:hypothetical protein
VRGFIAEARAPDSAAAATPTPAPHEAAAEDPAPDVPMPWLEALEQPLDPHRAPGEEGE